MVLSKLVLFPGAIDITGAVTITAHRPLLMLTFLGMLVVAVEIITLVVAVNVTTRTKGLQRREISYGNTKCWRQTRGSRRGEYKCERKRRRKTKRYEAKRVRYSAE